jgi:hypothetical protein
MARVSHYLMLAACVALVLLQPAIAQAGSARSRYAAARHCHCVAHAYPRRGVAEILAEVWTVPVYGTFGGYEDTFWASHYPGPVERRYFGYGWDPRLRF